MNIWYFLDTLSQVFRTQSKGKSPYYPFSVDLQMAIQCGMGWLKQSWLRLNLSKMEALWLGQVVSSLGCQLPALDRVPLRLAQTVRSLGVIWIHP